MTRLRTDVVVAFIVRRVSRRLELLQLRRSRDPMAGTWQPVMGHARRAESAVACMWRELREETGLRRRSGDLLGVWALERVHPYFIARLDAIVLSPTFVAEVPGGWEPRLNHEHNDARWVDARRADRFFMWPSHVAAVNDITSLLRRGSLHSAALAISPAR